MTKTNEAISELAKILREHRRARSSQRHGGYECTCGVALRSNSQYAQSEHQAVEVLAAIAIGDLRTKENEPKNKWIEKSNEYYGNKC